MINIQGGIIPKGYSDLNYTAKSDSNIMTLEEPWVLVTDLDIEDPKDLIPAMEFAKMNKKALVVFAASVGENCKKQVLFNLHKDIVKCVCIELRSIGDLHLDSLEDLSVLFDSTRVQSHNRDILRDSGRVAGVLGRCKEMKVDVLSTEFLTSEYKSPEHRLRLNQQVETLMSNTFHWPKTFL